MRVVVLGAAGRTGRELVAQASAAGHEVVAFARDRAALQGSSAATVVEGDATVRADVERAVAGADAVLSALGPRKGAPATLRRAAEAVVAAMQAQGVRRLVWLTGAGVVAPGDPPSAVRSLVRALMRVVARDALEDADAAFRTIAASGLEWTVVRAPRLSDGPAKGGVRAVERPPRPVAVTRADVAAFMLAELSDRRFVGRAPFVVS